MRVDDTPRSACSHQPRWKTDTLTLKDEHHQPRQRRPIPATRLHENRGRSRCQRDRVNSRTSLGNYYGALVVTVSQLNRMPQPVNVPDLFGELVKRAPKLVQDWWAAAQFISTERKMREVLGPEPFAAAERVILAHAPLTILPLPAQLRAVLDESLDFILEISQSRGSGSRRSLARDAQQACRDLSRLCRRRRRTRAGSAASD